MKKVIGFIAVLLAMPAISLAQPVEKNITFTWNYNGDAEFVRSYERTENGKVLIGEVAGDVSMMTVQHTVDTINCSTFFLAAVKGGVETYPSNGISWCPENTLPPYIQRPLQISADSVIISVD